MNILPPAEPFPAARFIKEIGRGKDGARSLSRNDAHDLYAAMLDGRVSDLEMGGILLAMRIKGESVEEIDGFLQAAEASFTQIPLPDKAGNGSWAYAPVVIPSYNGARHMANLTPLLAMLLAREGVPVLLHGVLTDPGRVTSAEILQALGQPACSSIEQAQQCFAQRMPAFMPIDALAPKMARLLAMRRILGVRNSTHTLVKIMQPFVEPALRLSSYTHPEYLTMLTAYFTTTAAAERGDVFLMRGTEGETVANARKAQKIDWLHGGRQTTLVEKQSIADNMSTLPEQRDAATTASWIRQALAQNQLVPKPIAEQVEQCLTVCRALRVQYNSAAIDRQQ
ncbi:glycosyl transferase family, helical bundle domain protein [Collimonas fungivorans]|uniref:Glycosyl transferase family, helical bundle domain protein n=1 Tax=Collimonas fungivorans TaxID=158899 RepID=A0A127P8P5_9BURK|nr:DNA-binding protein YbiB [Collimonas fungivorans]AMO94035.1 glycosyl transferase family, helical bundle domain protein [Collimonas fungivorans]